MGGIHLQVENLKSFPITSKQLYFLAEHDFIAYPDDITTTMINNKNKSDGLRRPFLIYCPATFDNASPLILRAEYLTVNT
jgi:hypothetical protein